MEYQIRAAQPFREIEIQTIDALERVGFMVKRTFRLRAGGHADGVEMGYSVPLLYTSGARSRPLGRVTLHERGTKVVLSSQPSSPAYDLEADLVVALTLGGFDFCVSAGGSEACIDAGIGLEMPDQDRRRLGGGIEL